MKWQFWAGLIIVVGVLTGWLIYDSNRKAQTLPTDTPNSSVTTNDGGKLEECPEAWVENRMPTVGSGTSAKVDEYMIVDGKRWEIADVDVEWVKANCEIKQAEKVY